MKTFSKFHFCIKIKINNNLTKQKSQLKVENYLSQSFKTSDIFAEIASKGFMTFHDFMQQSLYNPSYGYYTTKSEVIGDKGDFITAPSASQMFGECNGIFTYKVLESFGFPDKTEIIEFGGGRGEHMRDILKALIDFKQLNKLNVRMIDVSPKLRDKQQKLIFEFLQKKDLNPTYKGGVYE